MKILLTLPVLLLSVQIWAQQTLDTIYANEHKSVALFFPKPIRQGIVGNGDFVFTYDREQEQYFGLLQAREGKESNLLAITNDGQVYAYILKYKTGLQKLNYFIEETESIGNERQEGQQNNLIKENKEFDRTSYFEKYCSYLLKQYYEPIATKRKKGIVLKLLKKVYVQSEVYLVMEIKNRSGIDFEVDYLNVYVINGNKQRKSSYQKLQQKVLHKYQMHQIIKDGHSQKMAYVLPKFVLGDGEKLNIEFREMNGGRVISLNTNL